MINDETILIVNNNLLPIYYCITIDYNIVDYCMVVERARKVLDDLLKIYVEFK